MLLSFRREDLQVRRPLDILRRYFKPRIVWEYFKEICKIFRVAEEAKAVPQAYSAIREKKYEEDEG